VVRFRPTGSESAFDACVRDQTLPALLASPGLVHAWLGRHGAGDLDRVLASSWSTAPRDPAPDVDLLAGLPAGMAADVVAIEALVLAIEARFERQEPARLLRILHGQVRSGELEPYIADARSGMLADAEVNNGLVAFLLGTDPPDAFVTVSVWTDWQAIERATGGNIRQPIRTRNVARLADFDVAHYEILPDAADRAATQG
jgi:hypothetical protein